MYTVEVTNNGTGEFTATARGNTCVIEPAGKGMGPAEALLASLGSCVGYFIRLYCEQTKTELKEFTISLTSEFSKEKPMALRQIGVRIDLKGSALDPRRQEALLAFVKNCPIKATLEANPRVDVSIA